MTGVWALAALWLGLALIASLLSIWLRISTALSEIVVGTIAQLIIGAVIGSAVLGTDESWIKFLSGIGAIVLTFLAGAELDPKVFKLKWQEATAIGLAGFFFPFLGCTAAAYYLLGWEPMPSWLAGVAMSTTSVAVVYAVMLEYGFNVTEYGKTVLAACFINDLGLRDSPLAGSHRGFSGCMAIGLPSWKRSSCFSAYLEWGRSRPGPTAKLFFPRISSEWCWRVPSARIMRWSDASGH